MLKILFRVRLEALKSLLTGSTRTKTAQSKSKLLGFAFLMIFSFFSLGTGFWNIFRTLGGVLNLLDLDWLFFTMVGILAFSLMFMGSIFTAKAQLYDARDNDLLLSMPIKPRDIVLSRMFMLWVFALIFDIVVTIPALIARIVGVGITFPQLICFILLFLVALPLLVLSISVLFGWLINLATAHVKHKSFVLTLITLVFVALYMFVYFKFNSFVENAAEQAVLFAKDISSIPLLYSFGRIVSEGNIVMTLLVTLGMVAIFALVCLILTSTFIRTTTDKSNGKKTVYVEKKAKKRSPEAALLKNEFSRFFGCPAYFINLGMGAILAPIAAVVLIIEKGKIREALSAFPSEVIFPILSVVPFIICAFGAMIYVTACSVSLEGRTFWISRSLPVSTISILRTKLLLHYSVSIPPVLLLGIVAAIVLQGGPWFTAAVIVLPLVFNLFVGAFGLFINLRHPFFEWTNETQAVKTGASVLISMFGSLAFLIVPTLFYSFLSMIINMNFIFWPFAAVMLIFTGLLYYLIKDKGVALYEEM